MFAEAVPRLTASHHAPSHPGPIVNRRVAGDSSARLGRPTAAIVIGGLLLIALLVRLQPWSQVFPAGTPGAVFVGDTDTYYHALRAERIASQFPSIPWTDSGMNFPEGADVLWPPLFDLAIAGIARLGSGGPVSRAAIERVAALLPPILGFATVGMAMALSFAFLRDRTAWWTGLLLALLPIHVEFSTVGRPDQHVAEALLQALVTLTFVAGWLNRKSARAWGTAFGVVVALSFWNWQGSVLYLALIAAFVAVWHMWDGDGADRACRLLSGGSAIGAVLLAVSIVAWGRADALGTSSLSGITGIQVMLTCLVSAFAAGLDLARRVGTWKRSAPRRVAEVALAAAVPLLAAAALFPILRDGVRQGLLALTAGNAWYAGIREFQPPLFGGLGIRHELASWLPRFAPMFAMPVAACGLAGRWNRCREDRGAVAFLLIWGVLLLIATLARMRFALYLSLPAVVWCAVGLEELRGRSTGWRPPTLRVVAASLLLLPAGFYFWQGGLWPNPEHREVARALEWLRSRPATDARRPAVFSEWDWGHLVQYFAGRPAIATPFGTDGGAGAMEDTAAFFLTTSPDEAARILDRRRAGYVLLVDPVAHAAAFGEDVSARERAPVRVEWNSLYGPRIRATPEVDDLVAVRIYFDSGLSSRGLSTLTRYRLVYEGPEGVGRQARLFEIVPGAELVVSGTAPGERVRASLRLRTNRGRDARWYVDGQADQTGVARLRVPFATGANGSVMGTPYRVTCALTDVEAAVPERAVESGARVDVRCGDSR